MSLFDDIQGKPATEAPLVKPEGGGGFSRPGYFNWKTDHAEGSPNEAIGVILPPYKEWIAELINATKSGQSFAIPFSLGHGRHAIGPGKKNKVFCESIKSLLTMNKVGNDYPLLHPDVVKQLVDAEDPLDDIVWNQIWPIVEANDARRDSPEYKAAKAAHRMAVPQRRFLVNFLPMGKLEPLVLELPLTAHQQLVEAQYDNRQPDFLIPKPISQSWTNCWVHIKRIERPDTTDYTVLPIYQGTPAVMKNDGSQEFDEAKYLEVLGRMKDLREESKTYVPKQEEITRALSKLLSSITLDINVSQDVQDRINRATAGVNPTSAAPAPRVATGPSPVGYPEGQAPAQPATPVAPTPAPAPATEQAQPQPATPAPAQPQQATPAPAPAQPTPQPAQPGGVAAPHTPPASANSGDSAEVFDTLQSLLGNSDQQNS